MNSSLYVLLAMASASLAFPYRNELYEVPWGAGLLQNVAYGEMDPRSLDKLDKHVLKRSPGVSARELQKMNYDKVLSLVRQDESGECNISGDGNNRGSCLKCFPLSNRLVCFKSFNTLYPADMSDVNDSNFIRKSQIVERYIPFETDDPVILGRIKIFGGGDVLNEMSHDYGEGINNLLLRSLDSNNVLDENTRSDLTGNEGLLTKKVLDSREDGHVLTHKNIVSKRDLSLSNRVLDSLGGGNLLTSKGMKSLRDVQILFDRQLDSLGGGNLLTHRQLQPLKDIKSLSKRELDSMANGNLLTYRQLEPLKVVKSLSDRGLDSLGGGNLLTYRQLEPLKFIKSLSGRELNNFKRGNLLSYKQLEPLKNVKSLSNRDLNFLDQNMLDNKKSYSIGKVQSSDRELDSLGGKNLLNNKEFKFLEDDYSLTDGKFDILKDVKSLTHRSLDSLGGGNLLSNRNIKRNSFRDLGVLSNRALDSLGGGHLLTNRESDPIRNVLSSTNTVTD